MPTKLVTPKAQIRNELNKRLKMAQDAIVDSLCYVGEEALRVAREGHRYKDRTGNLSSSIGYVVLVDGRVAQRSSFDVVLSGREGSKEGREFLNKLISANSKGIVFIMVAGMPYAEYVEAMSLNVLDSAEQLAERMIPKITEKLKF